MCSSIEFLSELELSAQVTAHEFEVIFRKFELKIGGRNDINYIAFCHLCDEYALKKWTGLKNHYIY